LPRPRLIFEYVVDLEKVQNKCTKISLGPCKSQKLRTPPRASCQVLDSDPKDRIVESGAAAKILDADVTGAVLIALVVLPAHIKLSCHSVACTHQVFVRPLAIRNWKWVECSCVCLCVCVLPADFMLGDFVELCFVLVEQGHRRMIVLSYIHPSPYTHDRPYTHDIGALLFVSNYIVNTSSYRKRPIL
jgi:hypothetical protein